MSPLDGVNGVRRNLLARGCSGVGMPPEYHDKEASNQSEDHEADLYPVLDRGGVSMSNISVEVEKISLGLDFSLDKAAPQFLAAHVTRPERDDAIDETRNVESPAVPGSNVLGVKMAC